jgi:chorismate mutase/prephenate dehydratase
VFGQSSEFASQDSIRDVFLEVEQSRTQYGIVPVENSIAGIVPETLDMFPLTNVRICAEMYLSVQHHLVSLAPDLASVQRVYTGSQPLNQCRKWLRQNLPKVEFVETVPTSAAAHRALLDPDSAAIAGAYAAEVVGIPILAERIEDDSSNRTRFLVIGFNEPAKTGRDKTSIIFNLRNRPGELYRALGILDREGVNLSMIESRPAANAAFEYLFFCDCNGHRTDDSMIRALADLKSYALETVLLGSYPASD